MTGDRRFAELIERLEKATGPDRDLDNAIHAAVVGEDLRVCFYAPVFRVDLPAYTRSIDAALTLVPEGFAWKVGTCCVSDDAWVAPDYNSPIHGDRLRREYGEPTSWSIWDLGIDIDQRPSGRPAIALCIAALKARSNSTGAP